MAPSMALSRLFFQIILLFHNFTRVYHFIKGIIKGIFILLETTFGSFNNFIFILGFTILLRGQGHFHWKQNQNIFADFDKYLLFHEDFAFWLD